jgi:hypothetical protein
MGHIYTHLNETVSPIKGAEQLSAETHFLVTLSANSPLWQCS